MHWESTISPKIIVEIEIAKCWLEQWELQCDESRRVGRVVACRRVDRGYHEVQRLKFCFSERRVGPWQREKAGPVAEQGRPKETSSPQAVELR